MPTADGWMNEGDFKILIAKQATLDEIASANYIMTGTVKTRYEILERARLLGCDVSAYE